MTLEEIRKIKHQIEDELLRRPGVTGVDIGYKITAGQKTAQLAIIVYVEKKGDYRPGNEIPKVIQGVPTDVIERTFMRHASSQEERP